MTHIPILITLSLLLWYVDYRLTAHNWGKKWNGVGAIPEVLAGKSLLPMQHRVLVPWLTSLFGRGGHATPYYTGHIIMRLLAITFALFSAHWFFSSNLLYTSLLAVFLAAAALFDYTDGYIELGFFALFLGLAGQCGPIVKSEIWLLALVTFLAALNRETALFFPVLLFLATFDTIASVIVFLSAAGALLFVRIKYGVPHRYCSFCLVGENLRRIKKIFVGSGESLFMREYLLFFGVLLLCVYGFLTGNPSWVEWGMGVFFCALLVPSIWFEIRVFAPVMLILIPRLV